MDNTSKLADAVWGIVMSIAVLLLCAIAFPLLVVMIFWPTKRSKEEMRHLP